MLRKRPRVFHPGATFAERLWRHEAALRPGVLSDWEMLAYLQRELVCPHCGNYRQIFEDTECEDPKYQDAVEAQRTAAERQKAERAHLQVVKPGDGLRTYE
jgi:hypothetical protein